MRDMMKDTKKKSKTTKGGRNMNPMDAYRKELRQKELKRNKEKRKLVQERLKDMSSSRLAGPLRRLLLDAADVRAEDSVYYHPILNPTGAPPRGKPPMYKSSSENRRIPLSSGPASSSSLSSSYKQDSDSGNAAFFFPPPPPQPPPRKQSPLTDSGASLLPPPPPPPPPPPGPPPKAQVSVQPPPPLIIGLPPDYKNPQKMIPPPPPPPRPGPPSAVATLQPDVWPPGIQPAAPGVMMVPTLAGPPPSFGPPALMMRPPPPHPLPPQKPISYIKTAESTVVKRPPPEHQTELTSMVPTSLRLKRDSTAAPTVAKPKKPATATTRLEYSGCSSWVQKPPSIDDSYLAFMEDMKRIGAL